MWISCSPWFRRQTLQLTVIYLITVGWERHLFIFLSENQLSDYNPELVPHFMEKAIQKVTWKLSVDKDMQSMACWQHSESWMFTSMQKWLRWTNFNTVNTMWPEKLKSWHAYTRKFFIPLMGCVKYRKLLSLLCPVSHICNRRSEATIWRAPPRRSPRQNVVWSPGHDQAILVILNVPLFWKFKQNIENSQINSIYKWLGQFYKFSLRALWWCSSNLLLSKNISSKQLIQNLMLHVGTTWISHLRMDILCPSTQTQVTPQYR